MNEYLSWSNFLPDDLVAKARFAALAHKDRFVHSTTTSGEPDYRESRILWHYEWPDLYDAFIAHLKGYYNHLVDYFPAFAPRNLSHIEAQMTLHSNGHFFKKHTDNGSPDTCTRMLTYVWYFSLEDDKRFEGGQLYVHKSDGTSMAVEPVHNQIVFFPSHLWHSVEPVVNDGAWESSRGTINGWFHRQ